MKAPCMLPLVSTVTTSARGIPLSCARLTEVTVAGCPLSVICRLSAVSCVSGRPARSAVTTNENSGNAVSSGSATPTAISPSAPADGAPPSNTMLATMASAIAMPWLRAPSGLRLGTTVTADTTDKTDHVKDGGNQNHGTHSGKKTGHKRNRHQHGRALRGHLCALPP